METEMPAIEGPVFVDVCDKCNLGCSRKRKPLSEWLEGKGQK